jgi:hypothetical protein
MEQGICLGSVHGTVGELVRTAHVVDVRVGEHEQRGALAEKAQTGERLPQIADPKPGVDDEVRVGASDVPHVGLHQAVHVRLPQAGQAVRDPARREPLLGYRQIVWQRSPSSVFAPSGDDDERYARATSRVTPT